MEKVQLIIHAVVITIVSFVIVSLEIPFKVALFTITWTFYIILALFAPLASKIYVKWLDKFLEYGMPISLPISKKVIKAYKNELF